MIGPTNSRSNQRRVDPRHAVAHVTLDVLDYNDRIIDNQSDREHDREQREQVQGEAEELH